MYILGITLVIFVGYAIYLVGCCLWHLATDDFSKSPEDVIQEAFPFALTIFLTLILSYPFIAAINSSPKCSHPVVEQVDINDYVSKQELAEKGLGQYQINPVTGEKQFVLFEKGKE